MLLLLTVLAFYFSCNPSGTIISYIGKQSLSSLYYNEYMLVARTRVLYCCTNSYYMYVLYSLPHGKGSHLSHFSVLYSRLLVEYSEYDGTTTVYRLSATVLWSCNYGNERILMRINSTPLLKQAAKEKEKYICIVLVQRHK